MVLFNHHHHSFVITWRLLWYKGKLQLEQSYVFCKQNKFKILDGFKMKCRHLILESLELLLAVYRMYIIDMNQCVDSDLLAQYFIIHNVLGCLKNIYSMNTYLTMLLKDDNHQTEKFESFRVTCTLNMNSIGRVLQHK